MAEGTRKNVLCPFYYYYSCRDGMSCKYTHDAACDNIGNIACEYFLKGICKYGDECLYNHTIITEVNLIPNSAKYEQTSEPSALLDMELCPHFFDGVCPYDECPFLHGEICELCRKYCLNPFDEEQRRLHIEVCGHEQSTNLPDFDKTCGICLDVVIEKNPVAERRFGILENCDHVFCLSCIIKWRKVRISRPEEDLIDPAVTRACPECRVPSSFYIPSKNWVHSKGEKEILIADYKKSLSSKHCKYFKNGNGICPFGVECLYLHAMPVIPSVTAQRRHFNNRVFWNSSI